MAWTPPPNWPAPPSPGWSPPAGWQPDPNWGPPPEDWVFWPDAAPTPTLFIDDLSGSGGAGGWAPQRPVSPWAAAAQQAVPARVRGGAGVVLAGGAISIIGAFGTWIRVSGPLGTSIGSGGMSGGHNGPFVLVLGLLAVAFGSVRLASSRFPSWLPFIAIALGALQALITIADSVDVHNKVKKFRAVSPLLHGHIGWGLVLSVVASFVVVLGGVACIDLRRQP